MDEILRQENRDPTELYGTTADCSAVPAVGSLSMGTHLAALQENSPRNAVAQVRVPLLIMYSSSDTVVIPSQSEDMARALKQNGKHVKLDGDDHWLSRRKTRTQMLKELETFLAGSCTDRGRVRPAMMAASAAIGARACRRVRQSRPGEWHG